MSDTNEWKKVGKDHVILEKKGFIFKKPINYETISYYCEICNSLIYTIEDVESYRDNKACIECFEKYYYNNKEKWDNGWRPKYI
tara:strand:- start:1238 stop:1489 length:252 start_codon:yes stop_codon:yes gene_type:complete